MPNPLLVACDDPDALAAALRSEAEALVFDLGDADAPGDRGARQRAALEALNEQGRRIAEIRSAATPDASHTGEGRRVGPSGPRPRIVRIAPVTGGLLDADLDAVMAGAPDAVLLPGVVGAHDLQHLAAKLAVREAEHGLAAGRTQILAMPADNAAGVLALPSLPRATPRLLALGWDSAVLAAALGVGVDAAPVRSARGLLVITAAAAGVPAFDRGLAGDDLATACAAARRDGFSGRFARRPAEIDVIANAFSPRPTGTAPCRGRPCVD